MATARRCFVPFSFFCRPSPPPHRNIVFRRRAVRGGGGARDFGPSAVWRHCGRVGVVVAARRHRQVARRKRDRKSALRTIYGRLDRRTLNSPSGTHLPAVTAVRTSYQITSEPPDPRKIASVRLWPVLRTFRSVLVAEFGSTFNQPHIAETIRVRPAARPPSSATPSTISW